MAHHRCGVIFRLEVSNCSLASSRPPVARIEEEVKLASTCVLLGAGASHHYLGAAMKWTSGDRSNIEDATGQHPAAWECAARWPRYRRPSAGPGPQLGYWNDSLHWLAAMVRLHHPSANVQPGGPPASTSAAERSAVDMVDAVMDDAQSTWRQILGGTVSANDGGAVPRCVSVLAAASSQSATGPFYRPADRAGLSRSRSLLASCRVASVRQATSPAHT